MDEFVKFRKIPRLFRDVVITEKIDGTNAAINIRQDDDGEMFVTAQSRNRVITPEDDNFGFARWVWDNLDPLTTILGPGVHFGEWWGSGIQRGYGLAKGEKRFSLFNTARWGHLNIPVEDRLVRELGVVPLLYSGPFDTYEIDLIVEELEFNGSFAAEGFMDPEGVVVYHAASNQSFKVTVKNDEMAKTEAAR